MDDENIIKFSFMLSGGEEITRFVELNGVDTTKFVSIRRIGNRYLLHIGPHTIDLPASLMKELVENILLTYPEDEELQEIIQTLGEDKPWLFERR